MAEFKQKLDFRFADEEDSDDIANLVNEAFSIEEVAKSKESFAFRSCPRIDPDLLKKELDDSQSTKWIVLETPSPEENVVATVALSLVSFGKKKEGNLKALAVLRTKQGQGIGNQLLRKAEAICRGHGCDTARIDIAMQRNDIVEWLHRHGYRNMAGGAWMHDGVVDVTQYMSMIKDLTKPDQAEVMRDDPSTPNVSTSIKVDASTNDPNFSELLELTKAFADGLGDLDDGFSMEGATMEFGISNSSTTSTTDSTASSSMVSNLASTSTGASTGASTGTEQLGAAPVDSGEDLESLLGSLMAQLRTPSGKQQFDELVSAEERNVLGVPFQIQKE